MTHATGGTITEITISGIKYRVHTFTSNGTLVVASGGKCDILLIAGGGQGGNSYGGGGGAGGVLQLDDEEIATGNLSVVIGNGATFSISSPQNGQNSTFNGRTAIGGGGGGFHGSYSGQNGGSGGGRAYNYGSAGLGTSGQGNNGFAPSTPIGGGGGGKGGAPSGAAGGPGAQYTKFGISTTFAVGGDGYTASNFASGASNTGNGGDAADGVHTGAGYGNGGSGILIVRYKKESRGVAAVFLSDFGFM